MKTGFENEYFVADSQGRMLQNIPWNLPHDAAGTLVEARSKPFDNPFKTHVSFEEDRKRLEGAVLAKGCVMHCLDTCPTVMWNGQPETAGFHIHFSNDTWKGLPTSHHIPDWMKLHDDPPTEIGDMIDDLDKVFRPLFTGIRRHPHIWRPKTWGWEYRRLPATVDPYVVASRLAELYYPSTLPKKKVI